MGYAGLMPDKRRDSGGGLTCRMRSAEWADVTCLRAFGRETMEPDLTKGGWIAYTNWVLDCRPMMEGRRR